MSKDDAGGRRGRSHPGRGGEPPHSTAPGSGRRSGQGTGDVAQFSDHLPAGSEETARIYRREDAEAAFDVAGQPSDGGQLPLRSDLCQRRAAAEMGELGSSQEGLADHREYFEIERLQCLALRCVLGWNKKGLRKRRLRKRRRQVPPKLNVLARTPEAACGNPRGKGRKK